MIEDIKEYHKQYKKDNADELKAYRHNYYLNNKERYSEWNKQNESKYDEHRECTTCDKLIKRTNWSRHVNGNYHKKLLYLPNNEVNKDRITCECGCKILKNNHSRHLSSKYHLKKINNV